MANHKLFKNLVIKLFMLIYLAVLFLISMNGCDREDVEGTTVSFVQAVPPDGSTIRTDETIVIVFDGVPRELSVTDVNKFTRVGVSVTVGPFKLDTLDDITVSEEFKIGTLDLVFTRSDGRTALSYTVVEPNTSFMVFIPAGEFEMASYYDEFGEWVENDTPFVPTVTVYVDAFYMDAYEVTNAQYKEFLIENPIWQKDQIDPLFTSNPLSTYIGYLSSWNGNNYPRGEDNHPVLGVNWYAAMAYAEWAGKRLPTMAEWERAALGGVVGKRKFPLFWDPITEKDANLEGNFGSPTPVGKYPANRYGLYDIIGNAEEWCLEVGSHFHFKFPRDRVQRNPILGGQSIEYFLDNYKQLDGWGQVRGGSYIDSNLPEDHREKGYIEGVTGPKASYQSFGFRCVR